jgi:hypothetical protein
MSMQARNSLSRAIDNFFNKLIHGTKYPYRKYTRHANGRYKAIHRRTEPFHVRYIKVNYMGKTIHYIEV